MKQTKILLLCLYKQHFGLEEKKNAIIVNNLPNKSQYDACSWSQRTQLLSLPTVLFKDSWVSTDIQGCKSQHGIQLERLSKTTQFLTQVAIVQLRWKLRPF